MSLAAGLSIKKLPALSIDFYKKLKANKYFSLQGHIYLPEYLLERYLCVQQLSIIWKSQGTKMGIITNLRLISCLREPEEGFPPFWEDVLFAPRSSSPASFSETANNDTAGDPVGHTGPPNVHTSACFVCAHVGLKGSGLKQGKQTIIHGPLHLLLPIHKGAIPSHSVAQICFPLGPLPVQVLLQFFVFSCCWLSPRQMAQ